MEKLLALWNKMLSLGIEATDSFPKQKAIRMLNAFGYVAFVVSSSYTVFLFLLDAPELAILDGLLVIGSVALILLSYFRFHTLAGFVIFSYYPAMLLLISNAYGRVGCEYYLVPLLIFSAYLNKSKIVHAIMLVIYMGLFFVFKYLERTVVPMPLADLLAPYFYVVNVIASFVFGVVFFRLLSTEYERNRIELKKSNKRLQVTLDDLEKKNEKIHILIKELSHRTKNNLQLITSLINLQARDFQNHEVEPLLSDIKNRIYSISLIHRNLYLNNRAQGVNIKSYVDELVSALKNITSFEENELKIIMEVDELDISIDYAVSYGIILNEILTNAFKHGISKADKKLMKIIIEKQSNSFVKTVVYDSGMGISKLNEEQNLSFGIDLVNTLISQLQGSIRFYENDGNYAEFVVKIVDNE